MSRGVRITGLVRLAETIRREIGGGISPQRKAQLRQTVSGSVAQVDEILRSHGSTWGQLPAPSRRAYQFLKEINWDAVREDQAAEPAPAMIRWTGLGRFADRIAARLAGSMVEMELDEIGRSIEQMSRRIELSLQQSGAGPEQLTEATRQWRAWFAWLAEQENLKSYVAAVKRAQGALIAGAAAAGKPPTRMVVQFRPISHMYKMHFGSAATIVELPTAMVMFDHGAFVDLAAAMFSEERGAKKRLNEHFRSAQYQDLASELEALGGVVEGTRGAFHDLAESFERVNARYFGGQMARPRLTWSKTFTGWKFGHYDHVKDWVMVSSTLDRAEVPAFVVDYLMFHELLHKKHGVRWVNERRMAHTREFHAEEQTFERYGEAEEWLVKLARR